MYTFMCLTLRTRRPVLCNTAQPIQLKFDFNLCMFLLGWAKCVCVCVCVCQHVEAWSFVQRHVYIPQAVKDWRRGSLSFSPYIYFFLLFLAFCAFADGPH